MTNTPSLDADRALRAECVALAATHSISVAECRDWPTGALLAFRLACERLGRAHEPTGEQRGIPHPSECLSWEQFWQRVREINFNPSPGELRAALTRYENRECPQCLRQLERDEITGSCIHNGGQHRRTLKSQLREATDQFAKDVSNALNRRGESDA